MRKIKLSNQVSLLIDAATNLAAEASSGSIVRTGSEHLCCMTLYHPYIEDVMEQCGLCMETVRRDAVLYTDRCYSDGGNSNLYDAGDSEDVSNEIAEEVIEESETENEGEGAEGFGQYAMAFQKLDVHSALLHANEIASKDGCEIIDVRHLFLAMFKAAGSSVMLKAIGVQLKSVKGHKSLKSPPKGDKQTLTGRAAGDAIRDALSIIKAAEKDSTKGSLDGIATLLNEVVKESGTVGISGRDEEIRRVIQTIGRKEKSNPMLVGHAGVGKTAIVMGLVKLINDGDCPEFLTDAKVYSISAAELMAGTRYRGDLEEKATKIIAELSSRKSAILFIDEIHTLIGSGPTGGQSVDLSNIFKPALASGEITVIGATTVEEYRKYFEKDKALSRRFQKVFVKEPSIEQSIKMLETKRKDLEQYHKVVFSDDAVADAVVLSDRYIVSKKLPDKAIDILDEAAAHKKVGAAQNEQPDEIAGGPRALKAASKGAEEGKECALPGKGVPTELHTKGRYGLFKVGAKKEVSATTYTTTPRKPEENAARVNIVDTNDIKKVVASIAQMPETDLSLSSVARMDKLAQDLSHCVSGQDEAIKGIERCMKISSLGIRSSDRPISCFMLAGAPGVGKTMLAEVLAEKMDMHLCKLDMSEYSSEFTTSRLVGAPSGYSGHENGGVLTKEVKDNPYSVVLFDEADKAHESVLSILANIMDDGYLSDANGEKVDFRHTVMIFTTSSSIGSAPSKSIGFVSSQDEDTRQDLSKWFSPGLLDRLDGVLWLSGITLDAAKEITRNLVEKTNQRLNENNISFNVTEGAELRMAEDGLKKNQGGRGVSKVVSDKLYDFLVNESPEAKFSDKPKSRGMVFDIGINSKGEVVRTYSNNPSKGAKHALQRRRQEPAVPRH